MKIQTVSPITEDGQTLLCSIYIPKETLKTDVRQPIHHIFLIDRSGSMWGTLEQVVDDLKKQVRLLQQSDAITFGWFSSKGEFGFPIKSFRVVNDNSFAELDRLFDAHKQAMNLTNFSDSLEQIEKIVEETSFLNARVCLTFFSDGWANSPSVSAEHRRVREIMAELEGRLDLCLTVSYGDYADRTFLAEMAQLAGGENVSSADLEQVSTSMMRFIRRAEFVQPRVKVELGKTGITNVFALDSKPETGGITLYKPNPNGEVYFAPSPNEADNFLYLIVRDDGAASIPSDVGRSEVQPRLVNGKLDLGDQQSERLLNAAFASAVVFSQNGQQDLAIDVLGFVGDEGLVQQLGSAYTPTERGNAEQRIREAIFQPENRWKNGFDPGCVPKPDAFCLLDLLKLIGQDETVRFHPRHPAFVYKKIGRPSTQKEGYPQFMASPAANSPLSDLVWNSEFLNMSARVRLQGKVELPESVAVDAEGKISADGFTILKRPASLPEQFETFVWRNYTLVKDGFLNVPRLPISCSPETEQKLIELEIFGERTEVDGKPFGVLYLDAIPVINRVIADEQLSAKKFVETAFNDEIYGAQLKVYKFLRDELDPNQEIVQRTEWTVEEQRFLLACGFREDGSFSPPVETAESTDHYDATSFKIGFKGFSSLPKVADVREKMNKLEAGETSFAGLTPAMRPMAFALNVFAEQTKNSSIEQKLHWLDDETRRLKQLQGRIRAEVQKPKFAMVLAHRWFEDLPNTDEETTVDFAPHFGPIEFGTQQAKIKVSKKEVKI